MSGRVSKYYSESVISPPPERYAGMMGDFAEAACNNNYAEALRFLSMPGFDVDADVEFSQMTTLWLCIADEEGDPSEHFKMVKLLIDYGADVNFTRTLGITVLMRAVEGQNYNIIKLLLDNGAQVNARDVNGETATDYAYRESKYGKGDRSNSERIVTLLRNYGGMTKVELDMGMTGVEKDMELFSIDDGQGSSGGGGGGGSGGGGVVPMELEASFAHVLL